MKRILLLLATAILPGSMLVTQAQEPPVLELNDWMARLDDSRLVANLSLPGTHDADTGKR